MAATDAITNLTEFLQHSGRFLAHIDDGEMVLRRPEGDDLVVLTRRHWQALSDGLRLMTDASWKDRSSEAGPAAAGPATFGLDWMGLLTAEDRIACVEDVRRATIAALESGRLSGLATLLNQWRATALATWDARQRRDRQEYRVEEPRPLDRP